MGFSFPIAQFVLCRDRLGAAVLLAFACLVAIALASLVLERTVVKWAPYDRSVTLVAVCLCLVMLGSSASLLRREGLSKALSSEAVFGWEFEVSSDPTPSVSGWRCRAVARKDGRSRGDVWLTATDAPKAGETLSGVGRFKRLENDGTGARDRGVGISGNVTIVRLGSTSVRPGPRSLVYRCRERLIDLVCPDSSRARALLAGCVLGYHVPLKTLGVQDEFSVCGLAHLVAVSGTHLAIVCELLRRLFEPFRLSVRAEVALIVGIAFLFVLVCGIPMSALRAWVMSTLASCSRILGRRSNGLASLSLAALGMIGLNPSVTGDVGFQLSVLSVAGLCLFGRYAEYALESILPATKWALRSRCGVLRLFGKALSAVVASASCTIVAQVVTLVVTIPLFGSVSLVSPVANALVGMPFATFVLLGVMAVALSWVPLVGQALLAGVDFLAAVMLVPVGLLSGMPLASVDVSEWSLALCVVAVLCMALLLFLWPRVRRGHARAVLCVVVLAIVLALLRGRWFAPARIVVLDVGQGDAILIRDGAGTILVDAGPDDAVASALARQGVWHLDAIVVTHTHDDHYGGIASLRGQTDIDVIIVGEGVRDNIPSDMNDAISEMGRDVSEIGYGDTLRVGDFLLRVVWPHGSTDGSENSDSLEMTVSYDRGGRSLDALLTGDAESDQTAGILASGDVGDIDVLKVGHHGSKVSISSSEADALAPEVSVASAGEGNSYGHPSEECVRVLEEAGSMFLCTKDVGDVTIEPGSSGPILHTGRRV